MRDADAYGQISGRDDYWWTPAPSQHGGLLFVDADLSGQGVDPESVADRLRSAPAQLAALIPEIAIRIQPSVSEPVAAAFARAVRETLERAEWRPTVHLWKFGFGVPVVGRPVQNDGALAGELRPTGGMLGGGRAVECAAILAKRNAIWRPRAYHYRMPGGAHSTVFVRLADAIRTPRDAYCLASWLAPKASKSTGVVIDTASITPLILALDLLAAEAGHRLGPVMSLESYPSTRLDAMRAVRDVDDGTNSILAVLSVHATGTLRDRLVSALVQAVSNRWALDVVVDKAGKQDRQLMRGAPASVDGQLDRVDTWLSLGEPVDSGPTTCAACRGDAARLVQIDPRTFDGMVLPEPDLMMPSAPWASHQRDFWQLVDESDALFLETTSDVLAGHPRHALDKMIGVKIDFDVLLGDESFERFISAAMKQLSVCLADLRPDGYTLVLIDERDANRPNFMAFAGKLVEGLGVPQIIVIPPGDVKDWPEEVGQAIRGAERILLLTLGLVSGLSLQRMLFSVQHIRRHAEGDYDLDALVVHSRPTSPRVRKTLGNAIHDGNLVTLWESFLPDDRYPLQEELAVLELVVSISPEADEFRVRRLQVCSNFGAGDQVLWGVGDHGGPDAARLSPMSYFGESLRARAAFAAVGAAVQHARVHVDSAVGAPLWRMFEMPAVIRSYYDPLILACILRWVRPTEAWWGSTPQEAQRAVEHLLGRVSDEEAPTLLPELLLAAAQGKIPSATFDLIRAKAKVVAASVTKDAAPLLLGLALLDAVGAVPSA